MADTIIRFRARVAKAGRNWHICIPIPLRQMVRHGDEYIVVLKPLKEGEKNE